MSWLHDKSSILKEKIHNINLEATDEKLREALVEIYELAKEKQELITNEIKALEYLDHYAHELQTSVKSIEYNLKSIVFEYGNVQSNSRRLLQNEVERLKKLINKNEQIIIEINKGLAHFQRAVDLLKKEQKLFEE